ncbi:type II toxin-antitoxin system PemK/MazF family toxin [Arcobacter sp. CECT 8985]|uniref:type II toxin-antitoxin system PemK/MazF family toxin n=1 Tax=Arcobacter sp. CECT 8985 TaxID=1935424 RepID=UPI00100B234C|nr:type II toxin-antitoxin system PemK/MazF family toxin [Arcobacter sp. CECT 8985]RXJ86856.1 growth inhibitor PemK [Arcobacter sp. CECT 8985]
MNILQYNIYTFNSENSEEMIYAVVLSPNEMNEVLKTVIVAPLCNQCDITPTTFLIDDITRVRLDQITTIEKINVDNYIAKINDSQIQKIKNTLDEMLIK